MEETIIEPFVTTNETTIVDASNRTLFTFSSDLLQKLPAKKQEQMLKEMQAVVDRYITEIQGS